MAGRGRELVVAVEFVAAFAILRVFREDTKASLLEDIQRPPTVLTQAGDGGPVRWTSMTVFTVTASSPLLRKGRTALIPILYILDGEHVLHSAVGDQLSKLVKGVFSAKYFPPVRQVEPTACSPAVFAVPTTDASATQSPPGCVAATNASTTPSNPSSPSTTAAATANTTHAAAALNISTATPPLPASCTDVLFWSTAAVRFSYLLRLCG